MPKRDGLKSNSGRGLLSTLSLRHGVNNYLKCFSQQSGNSNWTWPMSHQLCWIREDRAVSWGTGLAGQSHPLDVTLASSAVLVLQSGGDVKWQGLFGAVKEEKASFFPFPDSNWGFSLAFPEWPSDIKPLRPVLAAHLQSLVLLVSL